MKTNRYALTSVFLAFLLLFDCATSPSRVDEAKPAPVPTTSTETVTDSGTAAVSGQGTSNTAVQGGKQRLYLLQKCGKTNDQSSSATFLTGPSKSRSQCCWTNANQVTPAVPSGQAETKLQSLPARGRPLICRFCQQQTFIPTWLTMIIKISRLKQLVCLKLFLTKCKSIPNILVDSVIWPRELLWDL